MLPRKFNDLLALVFVVMIGALWAYAAISVVNKTLDLTALALIITPTITVIGGIQNYYFRKSPPPEPKP